MKRVSPQSDVIPSHKTAILIVDYRSWNLYNMCKMLLLLKTVLYDDKILQLDIFIIHSNNISETGKRNGIAVLEDHVCSPLWGTLASTSCFNCRKYCLSIAWRAILVWNSILVCVYVRLFLFTHKGNIWIAILCYK